MDINRNNYETIFLLYLDRELRPAEMEKVDRFLNENADLQKEFAVLQQTILMPVDLVFEPKELLMRREEKRKVVPIYWMRIAAAVALLILGTWFLFTQLPNHSGKISGDSGIAKSGSSTLANPENRGTEKNNTDQQSGNKDTENNNQINQLGEKKGSENLNPEKSFTAKKGEKTIVAENQGGKNQSRVRNELQQKDEQSASTNSGETGTALQKSSTALDLQSAGVVQEKGTKQIAGVSALKATDLLVTTNNVNDLPAVNENVNPNESDFQTDNAISVVALNDRNKSIAGFFKKLTKRAPADQTANNTRKLRVSVFQISY